MAILIIITVVLGAMIYSKKFTQLQEQRNQEYLKSIEKNPYPNISPNSETSITKISSNNQSLQENNTSSTILDSERSKSYVKIEYPNRNISEKNIGKKLNCIPENYTIIDLEITGINSNTHEIIEIACIKIHHGEEVDKFESIIKPSKSISKRITQLTGITNEMVANAPAFCEIAQEIWNFLSDEIIVAHNANFDINFLYNNFLKTLNLKFSNDFVDTLPLCRKVYNFESYKLEYISEKLNITSEHHRAMADCLILKEIINDMITKIIKSKLNIEIPIYKLESLGAESASKYAMNLVKSIREDDYETFESVLNFCNELLEKDLATVKLCKKMASICEKFEEYDEAISFYESAMDIDPELDYYKKIERLEKKLYNF